MSSLSYHDAMSRSSISGTAHDRALNSVLFCALSHMRNNREIQNYVKWSILVLFLVLNLVLKGQKPNLDVFCLSLKLVKQQKKGKRGPF